MSPEQAAGNSSVDGRTDVYSLGLVVYEMLGGHLPLGSESGDATSPHNNRAARDEIPAAVDRVVARALAARPADRYATAGEFAGELRQALAPAVSPASPIRDTDRRDQPRKARRAMQRFVMKCSPRIR